MNESNEDLKQEKPWDETIRTLIVAGVVGVGVS